MKNKGKNVRFSIPLYPVFDRSSLTDAEPKSARVIGYESEKLTISDAIKNRETILGPYKSRYKRGDKNAVIELIEREPIFKEDPWVKRVLGKIFRRSRPGRKWDGGFKERWKVRALVDSFLSYGLSKNREKAFQFLSAKLSISYNQIKRLYYESYDTQKSPDCAPFITSWAPKDNEPKEDFESALCKFRDAMSKGMIYHPEHISLSGLAKEEISEVLSAYIEEGEKLLERNDDSLAIRNAKEVLRKNDFLEKARSLKALYTDTDVPFFVHLLYGKGGKL